MPYLRISRARYSYQCARCSNLIRRGQRYFRDEPHPFARMRGEAVTQQLCLECVLGADAVDSFLEAFSASGQLPLGFELTRNGFLLFPPRVELVDFTPYILRMLADSPEDIHRLKPDVFESLIGNRLEAMGLEVVRVGTGTYHKDGGVDFVAWPTSSPIPFLMAVQAKHTGQPDHKIGPAPGRELFGTVQANGFNAGLLVTNTTFTPDARWFAEQRALLMGLRDIGDLRRWLRNEYLREAEWRSIPAEIEICPGVTIRLPR